MRQKILLLNPPGNRRYLRDYYCSSVAKADYYWHPGDLLIQSGILDRDFDVALIDAAAEGLGIGECMEKIKAVKPDHVFFLAGAASWRADFDFAGRIDAHSFFASGEIFAEGGAPWLSRYPFLTGVVRDFTNEDIAAYLHGDFSAIRQMDYKKDGKFVSASKQTERTFSIPVPLHELFVGRYRMPLMKHRRFASVLTDFGCPHRCAYCNSGSLGYKVRPAENIRPELVHIAQLGIRQVFVKDMSFGANKKHAREMLDLFCEFDFDWHCYARTDDLDVALLAQMKRAGCFLVQMGIDHVDLDILEAHGKSTDPNRRQEIIRACRELKIAVGAHFVIGLPGETESSLRHLERYLGTLQADYVSINLAAPRFGSALRASQKKAGIVLGERHEVSATVGKGMSEVPPEILRQWRNRMIRAFYANGKTVLRQMMAFGGIHSLWQKGVGALALLRESKKGPGNLG